MSLLYPEAGKDCEQEEKRVTEDEMVHGIFDSADMSLSKFQETVKDRKAWRTALCGVARSQTRLSGGATAATTSLGSYYCPALHGTGTHLLFPAPLSFPFPCEL